MDILAMKSILMRFFPAFSPVGKGNSVAHPEERRDKVAA